MPATDTAVRCEVTVDASLERAFDVFVAAFDSWWPRSHTIAAAEMAEAVIEPRAGGRFYERGVDGSETVWGEVLTYDPPRAITLSWHIGGDWQLEDAASEIQVSFTPNGAGTKVALAHDHLERHTAAEALRAAVGGEGDGGWNDLLKRYSEAVSAAG
ncbi:MAG TPA: SRPBCC family protein [Acetobacteraceae bacterium]|nr:SRPBCC family protein [Acetobacteraceae bacterium]